jgi:hypothetical protein
MDIFIFSGEEGVGLVGPGADGDDIIKPYS